MKNVFEEDLKKRLNKNERVCRNKQLEEKYE